MPYADPVKDRESSRKSAAIQRAKDPERFRAAQRKYRALHTERKRLSGVTSEANRAAARAGVPGTLTTSDVAEIRERDAGICAYCFGPGNELDHCTPLARGGHNTPDNIVTACRSCNAKKHTKTVLEFLL